MALYIKSEGIDFNNERPYYVGTKNLYPSAYTVLSVQADGDELQYIHDQIMGIPRHVTKRVQKWFGDHAKFIVQHLW